VFKDERLVDLVFSPGFPVPHPSAWRCGSRAKDQFSIGTRKMKSSSSLREDARFRVLHLLQENPNISQRDIANRLGISLGGVNYCLRGLVEKGLVKLKNAQKSESKLKYAYLLTPHGIAEKSEMTARFLKRRMREYEAIRMEIEAVSTDVDDARLIFEGPEIDVRGA
jgi:EPS-associated MarR family transcriptional regulator